MLLLLPLLLLDGELYERKRRKKRKKRKGLERLDQRYH